MSNQFKPINPDILIDNIAKSISLNQSFITNATYETGKLGTALFYYYYGKYKQDESSLVIANDLVESTLSNFSLNLFEKEYGTDSLDNHLSNIGRFVGFANSNGFIDLNVNSYLANFDEIMFQLMRTKIQAGDLDINSGAIASGEYFLSRIISSNSCREPLEYMVNNLEKIALVDEEGDYFWKAPSLHDRIYFGLSHGSAMIIAFLSRLAACGIQVDLCHELIRKSVSFVIKHKRTQDKGLFPIQLNDKIESTQFSMCYGDLGVGYALLRAAKELNDDYLQNVAMEVLIDCTIRNRLDGLTLDASITYGASGIAATFGKLNQLSNHPRFSESEKYWYSQIPHYAFHENNYAGFKSRLVDPKPLWNICFGWGITGIGISMINGQDLKMPRIDKLLMIA
ncbi:lanthionine synthetase LanC family protein [Pedobacter sp. GR22-10]|uniref:lanthionine synthetase LanC family protein n=1 Tax=Pedobacter sp. GR22-10 TaxID=2994472 RepID=UPI0022483AC3|nr:lanthionine synthetase LanC family protein [Pedobacter sp. GR22-10]MCX2432962.1 hypothetical protein [Pedobacter sp. GR22-10]